MAVAPYKIRADRAFFCHAQVQPTDVDSYGVVKNTVYHEYLYAARVAFGASLGFPLEVLLEEYGVMTATISVTTHFKRYELPSSNALTWCRLRRSLAAAGTVHVH